MKRKLSLPGGFVTILMIFLVICLVTAGGLAVSATSKGGVLTDRSREYLTLYREAYNLSERRLAQTDGCIAAAANSGLFDMNFDELSAELDFAECVREGNYYIISCTTPIDSRTAVYWEIKVNAFPVNGRGEYELITRKTADITEIDPEDDNLNVWQGDGFLF